MRVISKAGQRTVKLEQPEKRALTKAASVLRDLGELLRVPLYLDAAKVALAASALDSDTGPAPEIPAETPMAEVLTASIEDRKRRGNKEVA